MSSFMDRLKARMGGLNKPLFERQKPTDKTRQVVITNRWDEPVWREARKTQPVDELISDLSLGDEHKGGARKPFDAAPELVRDLFFSFYKAAPRLEDKRNIERDVYAVRSMLEELLANPKLQDLQALTASDPITSTVALDGMGDTIREIITRMPPPPPPPQPKPKKVKKKKQEKKDPGDQSGEQEGTPGEQGKPDEGDGNEPGGAGGQPAQGTPDPNGQPAEGAGAPDPNGQGEEGDENEDEELTGDDPDFDPDADADDEIDDGELEWEQEFDESLKDLDLERMMNKALDAAGEEAEELDKLRKGIGLEDGEWASMSPEERLELAEKLRSPEMKALSEVIGRMKRFALGIKAQRVTDVPHEAYDVETGDSLPDLLNSQWALLADEATELEFLRRFTHKELLQFKKRGTEEVGKGPIVIAIDKSGSMQGDPFNWAMAVAESLRRFASEEDRDYYAMFFGANNDRNRFEFPQGKGPFEKVMTFLSCIANGGTQFDGVLDEALEKATTAFDRDARGKADIVFITDGQAGLSDQWIEHFNAERARTGVRMYSVYIGGAYDMGRTTGPLGLLQKISDVTIPVKELKPDAVKQIFQHV